MNVDNCRPIVRTIEVRVFEGGYLEVVEDGKTTEAVTFGEMLEQIISLVHPGIARRERYSMKTPEEWAAERAQRAARIQAEIEADLPAEQGENP